MAEKEGLILGQRHPADIALDLLKLLLEKSPPTSPAHLDEGERETRREEILKLYSRCKEAVVAPTKGRRV